ncbi:MAG: mandelate racemase/muconate lactonizing enzyme family protein [Rhodospirillales bacterium]|jgi:galactonate dehydratase|nr:mandelate racemase/muconate lactonizing enzyme family protein [Rhodospirillales bacterium]
MKITDVKTYIVPEHVSSDDWCRGKAWLLIKVETDTGIEGWGEAYVANDREHVMAQMVQELARYLDGMDPMRIKYFKTMATENFAGNLCGVDLYSAVTGIEIALWDIVGKTLGTPVHNLLGGPCRNRIEVYANCWSTSPRTPDELANYAAGQVALGFKAVKIYPFLYSTKLEQGIERLNAVRETLGPDINIKVDAWRVAESGSLTKIADALRACDVEWFEDPISPDTVDVMADIRRITQLPIVTGETFCTKQEFRVLLENHAADIMNPDITCCGILEINEIAAMAQTYKKRVTIHNYNTMAIGLSASLQVAAVIPNFTCVEYFQRFDAPTKLFAKHNFKVEDDGCIALSNEPGLGVSIDETALANFDYKQAPIRQWPDSV